MTPSNSSHEYWHIHEMDSEIEPGLGRSAQQQGGYQIATVAVTLAVAISGGLVTGNR